MCLDTITSRKPKPTGVGYVLREINRKGKLISIYFGTHIPQQRNRWLQSETFSKYNNTTILAENDQRYPKGFHIFATLQEAKDYSPGFLKYRRIFKVQYRQAHTLGTQCMHTSTTNIIVAKEIILKEEILNA